MKFRDKFTGEEIDTRDSKPRLNRLKRRVIAWGEALDIVKETHNVKLKMITLTYRPDVDWEKNQMRDYMNKLKKYSGDDLFAYAWAAELMESGVVHYLLFCAVTPQTYLPTPDSSGMWPHGWSEIQTGKSIYYLLGYAMKIKQKEGPFPKHLRMFHVWTKKGLLSKRDEWIFRLSAHPIWLVEEILKLGDYYLGHLPIRKEGGGWKIKHPNSTKKHVIWVYFPSRYEVVHMGDYAPAYEMNWLDDD